MAVLYLKYMEKNVPLLVHLLLCLGSYLFWLPLAVLGVPLVLAYFTLRYLLDEFVAWQQSVPRAPLADVPFLTERTAIVGYFHLEGRLCLDDFKRLVQEKMLVSSCHPSYRRLRQYIDRCLFTYVWRDEECFRIEDHVFSLEHKSVADSTEAAKFLEEMHGWAFEQGKSPWKLIVVSYGPNGEDTALFAHMHHGLGDGFSFVSMFSKVADTPPVYLTPKTNQGVASNIVHRIARGVLSGPWTMIMIMVSAIGFKPKFPSAKNHQRTIFTTSRISLDKVKAIKNATGTTVNDVLTSALAGAFRRYIRVRNDASLVDWPITITFNTRSLSQLKMDSEPQLCNQSGGTFFYLPISVTDPLERLTVSKSRLDLIKRSSDGHMFSFLFSSFIGGLPEPLTRLIFQSLDRHSMLLLSNIPGPLVPMHILCHRVVSLNVVPPVVGNLLIAVAMMSYAGKVSCTITAPPSIIPNPEQLGLLLEDEVDQLLAHTVKTRS